MANLAQEEVDRLFSQHTHSRAHPEDLDNSDHGSGSEKDSGEPAFANDPNEDTDDDVDISNRMAALSTTKSTYILPATEQYANTGPKGVIADAQSFTRAKRDAYAYKKPLTTVTAVYPSNTISEKEQNSSSEEEEDDEFMEQWRAVRLAELAAHAEQDRLRPHHSQQRRVSPSRRTYGSAVRVDALGYLDAIEKVHSDTNVVVMIYDSSTQSEEVEDEIDILAYKYGHVRFVKLDHEIAEMEHIQIPALLAYRGGEVYATVSGAKREGLESTLAQQNVLQ